MTTHTDRWGRSIDHATSEAGEVFTIPGAGTVTHPAGTTWAEARAGIEAMAPPAAEVDPVPTSIPAWKGKVVLQQQGLLAAAQTAIAGAGPVAQIAWAEATDWSRSGALLASMAAALDLSPPQVDALFRAADSVTV